MEIKAKKLWSIDHFPEVGRRNVVYMDYHHQFCYKSDGLKLSHHRGTIQPMDPAAHEVVSVRRPPTLRHYESDGFSHPHFFPLRELDPWRHTPSIIRLPRLLS
jgi:hypothetical protein